MWLAVSCPYLMLDALGVATVTTPTVCAYPHDARVLFANPAAQALGIHTNTSLSLAFTLSAELDICEPNDALQQAHLESLAQALGECSATICLVAKDCLVLEIGSMVRYFGSWQALLTKVSNLAHSLVTSAQLAWAPTPLLAQWRAQAPSNFWLETDSPQLQPMSIELAIPQWLEQLPIQASRWQPQQLERLAGLGFQTFDELYRLPASSLRQHLGEGLYQSFAKAAGTAKDPLVPYQMPDTFVREVEFDLEVEYSLGLLFPLKNIVQALCIFLTRRRWTLYELQLRLVPAWSLDGQAKDIELTIVHDLGTDSAKLWLELIELKLNRLLLETPIRTMHVRAGKWESSVEESGDLFDDTANRKRDMAVFVSRLQARLGADAIRTPTITGSHLPESYAEFKSINVSALSKIKETPSKSVTLPQRPHWLLPNPVPITFGQFTILSGPERVSTAWWQSTDGLQRRDYYHVRWHDQRIAWVFCDDHKQWFLHGWFA